MEQRTDEKKIGNKQQDDIFESNVSMIIFNVNFLNIPIQWPQTDRLDQKARPDYMLLQDIHFKHKN